MTDRPTNRLGDVSAHQVYIGVNRRVVVAVFEYVWITAEFSGYPIEK
jgi:hypothetical protein